MAQNVLILKSWKSGYCQLKTQNCEGSSSRLEWHHESYAPSPKEARKLGLGLYCCHSCHNTLHFRAWQLTEQNKRVLILARLGSDGRVRAAKGEIDIEELIRTYEAPRRE